MLRREEAESGTKSGRESREVYAAIHERAYRTSAAIINLLKKPIFPAIVDKDTRYRGWLRTEFQNGNLSLEDEAITLDIWANIFEYSARYHPPRPIYVEKSILSKARFCGRAGFHGYPPKDDMNGIEAINHAPLFRRSRQASETRRRPKPPLKKTFSAHALKPFVERKSRASSRNS